LLCDYHIYIIITSYIVY